MPNIDLPALPEGYEYTGEYRQAMSGELFASGESGQIIHNLSGLKSFHCFIVKKKRWRAEIKGFFYYVNSTGDVRETEDRNYEGDSKLYNLGNYFQTKEEAKVAALKIKQAFKELHDDNL